MQFLESPCKLWTFGDLADKRAALNLTCEGRIRYNREEGFRTAATAIPFSIFTGLDVLESDASEMVPQAGLEPACLAALDFESSASTISPLGHSLERMPKHLLAKRVRA